MSLAKAKKVRVKAKNKVRRSLANTVPSPIAGESDGSDELGPAVEALKHSLIFNLVTLTNKITTAQSNYLLENFGIGIASAYTMGALRLEPGILPARICSVTTMDKSVVSRALNDLEAQGYVARKSDPTHPRRERWQLTRAGIELQDSSRNHVIEVEALVTKGFSKQDREGLFSLFWRMRENIPALQDYISTVRMRK